MFTLGNRDNASRPGIMPRAYGFFSCYGLQDPSLPKRTSRYFVLNADDDRVIGKKGSQGFFIYKTGQG
ncbi:hypothetical protein Y032_0548g3278 [Ancylostoma ceylanicum]|uniref:Uncharacterized protein n=1 Tax=Ancylostoma ceylanicum TaxID=53326 RepID=A0A016WRU0_9BILA|nr:hypothetical protein Y032_0548g3278 [Ancylostoma ceylanicum]